MKKLFFALGLLLFFGCSNQSQNSKANQMQELTNEEILFVGTYTRKEGHVDGQGEGVYVYAMNKETGALTYKNVSESIISPSYLAVHPSGKYVYAANEFDGGEEAFGSVTALAYDATDHSLSFLNEVSSLGQYPCHVSIDNSGHFVMAANYVGGSVVMYPIEEGGFLGEYLSYKKHTGGTMHPRQAEPHAHQIIQHPRLGFVTAVDLGADKLYEYRLDTLSRSLDFVNEYPSGPQMAGPRHIAFHPTLDVSYTLNELIGSIEVTQIGATDRYSGNLQVISTLMEGDERDAASGAIKVHPNGQFLYVSNRGEVNDIAIFSIGDEGQLTPVGHQSTLGKTPRDFEIDPSGQFLLVANQDDDTIVTLHIDQQTGLLAETGYVAEVPTPVCIKFLNN